MRIIYCLLFSFTLMLTTALPVAAKEIADRAENVHPLLVGQSIPDVMIWNDAGTPLKSLELVKKQPTILVFYRGGWCPYCNAQLNELKGIEPQLKALGYQLIAISPELPDSLKEMQQSRSLSYQLMSDFRLEVAKAFGLAFRVDPSYAKMAEKKVNAKMQKYQGETLFTLPVPAVYIFDTKGVVQFQYVNPNYAVRLHPELLLTAAKVALTTK